LKLELKADGDWVKQCVSMKIDGTKRRRCSRRTSWDFVRYDMKSFGLPCDDVPDKNDDWRMRIKSAAG